MVLSQNLFLAQERLDLEDINLLISSAELDAQFFVNALISNAAYIVSGFNVTSGVGSSTLQVSLANAALLNSNGTNGYSYFVAPSSVSPLSGSLVSSSRNYVEVYLSSVDGTPLPRNFWDPTANNGAGGEFIQTVNTVVNVQANLNINTTGFTNDGNHLPVAIIDTNGSGAMELILDQRNLFFRLGYFANTTINYSWQSDAYSINRNDPTTQLVLASIVGTFQVDETITFSGVGGGATAVVVSVSGSDLYINQISSTSLTFGNTITGGTSGATATVQSIQDSFSGADKSISNFAQMLRALMTEVKLIKGTDFWFNSAPASLSSLITADTVSLEFLNSFISPYSSTGSFSWDGSNFRITDKSTTSITLSSPTGTFQVGESVTIKNGLTTVATATVQSYTSPDLVVYFVTAALANGYTVTGNTSGATGTISAFTANPLDSDVISKIRMLGYNEELSLLRQDGQGGTSAIAVPSDSVCYVTVPLPASPTNTNYSNTLSGSGYATYNVVSRTAYVPNTQNYWIAYNSGSTLVVRGFGELQVGEQINIGDELAPIESYVGMPSGSNTPPDYSSNIRGTVNENLTSRAGVLTDAVGDEQEDRSAYIRSDGQVTWEGTSLTVNNDIVLEVLNTKGGTPTTHTLHWSSYPASLPFNSGDSYYVEINRTPSGNAETINVASPYTSGLILVASGNPFPAQTEASKDIFVLFKRLDTSGSVEQLYLPFNKQLIGPGQSVYLGASGSSGGGGGGSSGINYITNSTFDSSMGGWSTYSHTQLVSAISVGSNATITVASGTGLTIGTPFTLSQSIYNAGSTSTLTVAILPTGVSTAPQIYYITSITGNNITFSTTLGGSNVTTSGSAFSGSLFFQPLVPTPAVASGSLTNLISEATFSQNNDSRTLLRGLASAIESSQVGGNVAALALVNGPANSGNSYDLNGNLYFFNNSVLKVNTSSLNVESLTGYNYSASPKYNVPTSASFGKELYSSIPPIATGRAMAIDSSGNVWLFGGDYTATSTYTNLLWKFNIVSQAWTLYSGVFSNVAGSYPVSVGTSGPATQYYPGSRLGASMAIDSNDNIWIFGGINSSSGVFNDLWKFSPSTQEWTWVAGSNTTGAAATTTYPGATFLAAMWISASNNLWIFGGNSGTINLNGLYFYNTSTNSSTIVTGSPATATAGTYSGTEVPGGTQLAIPFKDSSNNFYFFGGLGYGSNTPPTSGALEDIWKVVTNDATPSATWTVLYGTGAVSSAAVYGTLGTGSVSNTPGGTEYGAATIDSLGAIWVYSAESNLTLWKFTPTNNEWYWMGGANSGSMTATDSPSLAGGGVSTSFTIDNADLGNTLSISFDYIAGGYWSASSGNTGSLSDVSVWIYDSVNNVLIQPAPYVLTNGTGYIGHFEGTFQTNVTSNNYVLYLHFSNPNQYVASLEIDNVSVSPQSITEGTVITDWQPYSLVVGATTTAPTYGSISINEAQWRRVGDSMEIMYQFYQTSVGTAGSGTYLYSLPPGYSINLSTYGQSTAATPTYGSGLVAIPTLSQSIIAAPANSTSLQLWTDASAGSSLVGSGNFSLSTAGDYSITFTAKVPIVGWSSNVQLNSGFDNRVVATSVYLNNAQTIPATTATQLVGWSVSYDTTGSWNTNSYTAPAAGIYSINFATLSSGTGITTYVYKNGSGVAVLGNDSTNRSAASCDLQLNAGDVLTFYLYSATTATMTSGAENTFVNIKKLSGSPVIAANSLVAADYTQTSSQSIAAVGFTLLQFNTLVQDTTGSVTTGASWQFTAPVSGTYRVSALAQSNAASWAVNDGFLLFVYLNGSNYRFLGGSRAAAATNYSLIANGTTEVSLTAGQYIQIYAYSDVATTTSAGTNNSWVTISKIN